MANATGRPQRSLRPRAPAPASIESGDSSSDSEGSEEGSGSEEEESGSEQEAEDEYIDTVTEHPPVTTDIPAEQVFQRGQGGPPVSVPTDALGAHLPSFTLWKHCIYVLCLNGLSCPILRC